MPIFRKHWYSIFGMQIGYGTFLPKFYITWPNQVSIGSNCVFEKNIHFKFDGVWKKEPSILIRNDVFIGSSCEFNISGNIVIGTKAMIASGCKFTAHDHGISLKTPMNLQRPLIIPIIICDEVWLGANVIVLKGVTIGKEAILGA